MEKLLEQHHLINILINKIQSTWRNRRIGDASLARRLDRLLIKENFVRTMKNYHQCVGFGGISNHSPIFMELLGPFQKTRAPFKFNSTWLMVPDYIKLVTDIWQAHPPSQGRSIAEGFCHTIIELKSLSIQWEKIKRDEDDQSLTIIENKLVDLMDEREWGFFTTKAKNILIYLEAQRNKILKER